MSHPDAVWARGHDGAGSHSQSAGGEIHRFQATDILGFSSRSLRRWHERYEQHGYVELVDKRRHPPSLRRIAAPEVECSCACIESAIRAFKWRRRLAWSRSIGRRPVAAAARAAGVL
jgi:Winged helix-turn helix